MDKLLFLSSIKLKSTAENNPDFPFSLPVIRNLGVLEFTSPVTIFIGDNGTGKSTLMEGMAAGLNLPTIGSDDVQYDDSLYQARKLSKKLTFVRSKIPKRGFFFRAEDFFGFTRRVARSNREMGELEEEYSRTLSGYGRDLAVGMARGQRKSMTERYGEDPDAFSHGQNFLRVLQSRIVPGGLYLMDEPETPLSPLRQLSLLSILKAMVKQDCQFIIATHSPILMAFPNAQILSFDGQSIAPIEYKEIEHVTLTRAFLNDPESFLRRL